MLFKYVLLQQRKIYNLQDNQIKFTEFRKSREQQVNNYTSETITNSKKITIFRI